MATFDIGDVNQVHRLTREVGSLCVRILALERDLDELAAAVNAAGVTTAIQGAAGNTIPGSTITKATLLNAMSAGGAVLTGMQSSLDATNRARINALLQSWELRAMLGRLPSA